MAKEKKGGTSKKSAKKTSPVDEAVNNKIIENFVSLQRVMTNLAVKIEDMSSQTSKLLELFEISAKAIADRDFSLGDSRVSGQISEKLDNLLEQNKVIAKGITLLHEKDSAQQAGIPIMPQALNPYIQPSANPYRPKTIPADNAERQNLNPKFVRPI